MDVPEFANFAGRNGGIEHAPTAGVVAFGNVDGAVAVDGFDIADVTIPAGIGLEN